MPNAAQRICAVVVPSQHIARPVRHQRRRRAVVELEWQREVVPIHILQRDVAADRLDLAAAEADVIRVAPPPRRRLGRGVPEHPWRRSLGNAWHSVAPAQRCRQPRRGVAAARVPGARLLPAKMILFTTITG